MISVYYNQKYGFLIVPNAIERFMGCYISIEPTIEIMAEETIDKIGCAIRKGIKIAESSPKVDESQLNNFWKQTKYKSFPTFSKNYQRIDLKQNGDELEIRRWERNNRGGYSRKTEEKDYINFSILGDSFIEQNSTVKWYNSTMDSNVDAFYKNIYPNAYSASHYKSFSLKNEADLQALYLTNSKYILSKDKIDVDGIEKVNEIGEVNIYKNTNTESIAKWYNKTISEDEYTQLTDKEKSEKLYDCAILNKDINIDKDSKAKLGDFNLVKPTQISGNVSADKEGLLMVAIPNEEGWNSYIDGKLVEKYIVDYGLIGIVVPEGDHKIDIKYTAPKMKEGSILSVIGLINFAIIFFVKERDCKEQILNKNNNKN